MKPRSILASLVLLGSLSYTAGLAVMSVDFGSEFVKIAIVKPGVPMEIVLNKESNRKTATIVSLKNGERHFGEPAMNAALRYPKSGYRYLLDVLGKHYDNALVTQYRKRFPFYDLEKDPETGAVLFKNEDGVLYSVEELVGMILQKAKEYAENFAEQPISEAVITVPAYFNQAERRAMNRSAELAGLKLLQLINDNTAVALNYGVFRRKIFNTTALNYMFFDMGASSTTATIVSYQVVKVKMPSSGVVDTFPQLTVRGIGFDRTLGGAEFQHRLTAHLARLFNEMKKKKSGDVTRDTRAMQKLFKEAGRVKQVLSANADHFAQVEGLQEDEDFRAKVTREEFETMCADLFPRIKTVVQTSLAMSEMTMDEISEVILMGGGTRVPRVQQALQEAIGREELGKGINSDEAAALGAVYQAAHLGKGFKVKKFGIKEATVYPIQVEFERVRSSDDVADSPKFVKRTLFGRGQSYPQKKVMTFNKHVKDFSFEVNYAELGFLKESELLELGNTSLQAVSLAGVEDAYSKHGETSESKGVKAHFRMDDSGLLYLDKVECQFEKHLPAEAAESEESTLSKIGSTISNLFGGGKADEGTIEEQKEEPTEEDKSGTGSPADGEGAAKEGDGKEPSTGDDGEKPGDEKPDESASEKPDESASEKPKDEKEKESEDEGLKEKQEKDESTSEAKQDKEEKDDQSEKTEEKKEGAKDSKEKDKSDKDGDKKDDKDKTEEKKKEEEDKEEAKKEKKPKVVALKADIKTSIDVRDLPIPSDDKFKQSKKLINELRQKDEEKDLLEKAKNEIEAFVFDFQDKLEQKEYKLCSTEDERIGIIEKLNTASDWLSEQGDDTPRKDYENKLKDMKSVTRDLAGRVKELAERPGAVEALNGLVNHTEHFLVGMKNHTGPPDEQPFTQVEYDALEKLIKETKEWNKTVHAEQARTPLTERPKFTVEDVVMKLSALDRELKYMFGKAKNFRPKPKPKPKDTTSTNKSGNASTPNETKPEKDPRVEEILKKIREEAGKLDQDILIDTIDPTSGESFDTKRDADDTKIKDADDTKLEDESLTLGEDDDSKTSRDEDDEKITDAEIETEADTQTDKPLNDEL